jgi:hypothetical protein
MTRAIGVGIVGIFESEKFLETYVVVASSTGARSVGVDQRGVLPLFTSFKTSDPHDAPPTLAMAQCRRADLF